MHRSEDSGIIDARCLNMNVVSPLKNICVTRLGLVLTLIFFCMKK